MTKLDIWEDMIVL